MIRSGGSIINIIIVGDEGRRRPTVAERMIIRLIINKREPKWGKESGRRRGKMDIFQRLVSLLEDVWVDSHNHHHQRERNWLSWYHIQAEVGPDAAQGKRARLLRKLERIEGISHHFRVHEWADPLGLKPGTIYHATNKSCKMVPFFEEVDERAWSCHHDHDDLSSRWWMCIDQEFDDGEEG